MLFRGGEADAMDSVTSLARCEFDVAVETLRAAGVTVHVFEDTLAPAKPDAVFPTIGFRPTRMAGSRFIRCIRRRAAPSAQDLVEGLRTRYR